MNCSGNSVAKLDVVVADGVAADDRAVRFFHFVEAAADNLLEDCGVTFFRKADDGKRGDGFATHGINIAERIGRRDLPKSEWIVDDGCEKIHGLH